MPARNYDRSILESHPAFSIPEVPAELRARTDAAGWSAGLLERVLGLRRGMNEIEMWLDAGFPTTDMIEAWVPQEEAVLRSTITTRQAGWNDGELIADLSRNAPEKVGDWDVVVQRGPNSFAQFRLQEHAYIILVEDLRVGLGMMSRSVRNSYIGGERTSVQYMSSWRVREGFRSLGISKMLLDGAGPGNAPFGVSYYWLVRIENEDRAWVEKVTADMADRPEGWVVTTDKLTATVTHLRNPAEGVSSDRIRPATEDDLEACCRLINRTHAGLDLFRPYNVDYLSERLHDPNWGPKPAFIPNVYGWDDFRVLTDDDGKILACGGLWDRGRDVREEWTHRETGETHVIESTSLMDFGYAEGDDGAMAELISHFLADTATLGRSAMTVAMEFLPDLQEACGTLTSAPETRELHSMPFVSPDLTIEVNITRPYTDLAYW